MKALLHSEEWLSYRVLQMLNLVSSAPRNTPVYFKLLFLPIAGTLAAGLVLTPVVMGTLS